MRSPHWTVDAVRSLQLGILVGCLSLALLGLIHGMAPAWQGAYLAVFCGLAAAEGSYSFHAYRRDCPLGPKGLWLRVLELGSLLVVRQIGEEIVTGKGLLQGTAPRFDPAAVAQSASAGLALFGAWLVGTHVARTVSRLGEAPIGDPAYVSPQRRLVSQLFAGGIVLFAAAGIAQGKLHSISPGRVHPDPVITAAGLIYFLVGIALLGQIQYLRLRRRWDDRQSAVTAPVGAAWARQGLGALAIAVAGGALLSAVEPGMIVGLLAKGWLLIVDLLGLLGGVVAVGIARVLLFVHALGLGAPNLHPATVHDGSEPGPVPTDVSASPTRPAPDLSSGGFDITPIITALLPAARWLLLWSVVLAGVGYRARVMRRRGAADDAAPPFWQALLSGQIIGLLRRLRLGFRPVRAEPRTWTGIAPAAGEARPRDPAPAWRLRRFRGRSPRDRVVHAYLTVVRRAERAGVSRQPSQTAHEFSAALTSRVPAVQEDLALLTEAFAEARYGAYAPPAAEIQPARERERRIGSALRRAQIDRSNASRSDAPTIRHPDNSSGSIGL